MGGVDAPAARAQHRHPSQLRYILLPFLLAASCGLVLTRELHARWQRRSRLHNAVDGAPSVLRLRVDAITSFPWRNVTSFHVAQTKESPFYGMPSTWVVHEIFDAFFQCSTRTLVIVGRPQSGEGMDLERARAALSVGPLSEQMQQEMPTALGVWAGVVTYESVQVGHWREALSVADADAVCAPPPPAPAVLGNTSPPPLWLRLLHGPGTRSFDIVRILAMPLPEAPSSWVRRAALARTRVSRERLLPPAPSTRFAMCTCVKDTVASPALLRLFLDYHALLGVGAFYIFAVTGKSERAATILAQSVAQAALGGTHRGSRGVAVTVAPWPFYFWQPSIDDSNYSQQVALNVCAQRYASAHEWMFFYDIDELLVLPGTTSGLDSWAAATARRSADAPFTAMRTRMAWSIIGANPGALDGGGYKAFASNPRPPPVWGGGADMGTTLLLQRAFQSVAQGRVAVLPVRAPPPVPPLPRGGFASLEDTMAAALAKLPPDVQLNISATCSAWTEGGLGAQDVDAFDDDARALSRTWTPLSALLEQFCWRGKPMIYKHHNHTQPPLLGTPLSGLSLEAMLSQNITRSPILASSREKYVLNTSAMRVHEGGLGGSPLTVNIHGVYILNDVHTAQFTSQPEHAYHLHLLNAEDESADAQAVRLLVFFFNKRAWHQHASPATQVSGTAPTRVPLLLDGDALPSLQNALATRLAKRTRVGVHAQ